MGKGSRGKVSIRKTIIDLEKMKVTTLSSSRMPALTLLSSGQRYGEAQIGSGGHRTEAKGSWARLPKL